MIYVTMLFMAAGLLCWALSASIRAKRAREQGGDPPVRTSAYHAGKNWDVSGPLRSVRDGEQWYVVGQGYVGGPISDPEEAGRLIAYLADIERKGGRA